jgi:hypothetical protein
MPYSVLEHSKVTWNGAGHYRAIEKFLGACILLCMLIYRKVLDEFTIFVELASCESSNL